MTAPVSVGYLRPAPGRITPVACEISYGGYPVTDDGTAPDWHYLTDISIEWHLDVALPDVRADCDLSPTARIGSVLTWHSDRTNLRGGTDLEIVTNGMNVLRCQLPGYLLGGTVTCDARIVLARQDTLAGDLAPVRPGTLLWHESRRVILEGDAGRLPTTVCDFAEAGIPGGTNGLWYLEIASRELGSAASQCLRIYINSRHPDAGVLLNEPESPQAAVLQRALRYDTYRQLLNLAISDDEFDARTTYARGSFGDVLSTVLHTLAPGRTVEQVRNEYQQRPTDIDAETMSRAWGHDA